MLLADGSIVFTENRADRLVRIAPGQLGLDAFSSRPAGPTRWRSRAEGELVAVQTTTPGVAPAAAGEPCAGGELLGQAVQPAQRPRAGPHRQRLLLGSRRGAGGGDSAPGDVRKTGLYWLDPHGQVSLVADDIRRPNGVALSPDETDALRRRYAGAST